MHLGKAFAVFLAVLAVATPAAAQYTPAMRDWRIISTTLGKSSDPVARKLIAWIAATDTNLPEDTATLMRFVERNPSWPRLARIRDKIEHNMPAIGTAETIKWFAANPPQTADGLRAYVHALASTNQRGAIARPVKDFWQAATLNKADTAMMMGAFGDFLKAEDHRQRLDNLLWQGRYSEAEYMLPYMDRGSLALARARQALAQMSPRADQLVAQVPASLQNDEGLLYERVRYRRKRNMDAAAVSLLSQIPAVTAHADAWWGELNILARREIEEKNYKAAYAIARRHKLTEGAEFSQAEWTLGWLSLKAGGNPRQAYLHFNTLYNGVQSAISKSRAAYWAAKSAEKLPNIPYATQWYKVGAQYPSTFYGQLCYEQVYGAPKTADFHEPAVPDAAKQAFERKDTVRAARILARANFTDYLDVFLTKIVMDAKTADEYRLAARLSRDLKRPQYAVQANKDAQQKLGIFLFDDGYPSLGNVPLQYPEKSLVHAITYRESMFNQKIASSAGALGLMQLMPGTAKHSALKAGKLYSKDKLTSNGDYNVLLGSTYLRELLDKYNGYYPLAIAAYNAGPGNVAGWLDEIGDPRQGRIDAVDWIEHIPIYETRNYVQRVMETYYIYRLRFDMKPATIMAFAQKR